MNVFERKLRIWVAECVAIGKLSPGVVGLVARSRVRPGQPHQSPDYGAHLADDLPDDAEDRLR